MPREPHCCREKVSSVWSGRLEVRRPSTVLLSKYVRSSTEIVVDDMVMQTARGKVA